MALMAHDAPAPTADVDAALIAQLQAAVGADVVQSAAEADLARHTRDFLNAMAEGVAIAGVAYPRTTAQVSRILAICQATGLPVVPQGGLTSMVGAAVPVERSLVLSLERMRGIEEIDRDAATMTVQAGTVLETVQQAADAAGFFFPLDLGGRGSAQVGGLVSTNAGGNRVLRFGMMRELVLGIEAVLADGTIVTSLNKMIKNNAGYDLKQLFIGSEGTLGIVTRAVLRLYPRPTSMCTGLVAVADYPALLALMRRVRETLGGALAAFEVMWPDMFALGTTALSREPPIAHGHGLYVLIETLGTDEAADRARFEQVLAGLLDEGLAADAVVAETERQRRRLWDIRDCPGEFPKIFWPQRSYDVSLPAGVIGAFVEACRAALARRWSTARTVFFGHIADSNLHLAVNLPDEALPEQALDAMVSALIRDFGGSVSAEHGIGTVKRDYLSYCRSDDYIALMRTLKRAMDPRGILNPGKVI